VEEVNDRLALMAKPQFQSDENQRLELFHMKIHIKKITVPAIFYHRSLRNLIIGPLVKRLGLAVIPHPTLYWLH
jgi:hypothetical protein